MTCSINDQLLCDETYSGGWALANLRVKMTRIFDKVIPLQSLAAAFLDRNKRKVEITFNIQRVQDTISDAELFILDHDASIPRTGDVKLITMGGSPTVALVVNGALISHELVEYKGKSTKHQYNIIGSPIFAPTPEADHLVTQEGDRITTEGGDALVTES